MHHRPMTRLALLALIVAGFLGFGADQARASHVGCGTTIVSDTKLHGDLKNCPGNGIVIGADNITLDLNGHTIDGDGVLGCDEFYACDFGVDNSAGHHGVTIKTASIRDFATAVFVLGGGPQSPPPDSPPRTTFSEACSLIESPGARIERNSISANGLTTDQAGLIVFDSSEVRIEGNSVLDNGDIGMFLQGVDDSRVERNSVSGNPEAGVILDGNRNDGQRKPRVEETATGSASGATATPSSVIA